MRITDVFLQTGGPEAVRKSSNQNRTEAKGNPGTPQATRAKDTYEAGKTDSKATNKAQGAAVAAHANAAPEIRENRVAEVRERIQSGYYNSDEFKEKLADRLMKDFGF
jgi:flagellar biosynthesis anti-sigma factor FlgM